MATNRVGIGFGAGVSDVMMSMMLTMVVTVILGLCIWAMIGRVEELELRHLVAEECRQ